MKKAVYILLVLGIAMIIPLFLLLKPDTSISINLSCSADAIYHDTVDCTWDSYMPNGSATVLVGGAVYNSFATSPIIINKLMPNSVYSITVWHHNSTSDNNATVNVTTGDWYYPPVPNIDGSFANMTTADPLTVCVKDSSILRYLENDSIAFINNKFWIASTTFNATKREAYMTIYSNAELNYSGNWTIEARYTDSAWSAADYFIYNDTFYIAVTNSSDPDYPLHLMNATTPNGFDVSKSIIVMNKSDTLGNELIDADYSFFDSMFFVVYAYSNQYTYAFTTDINNASSYVKAGDLAEPAGFKEGPALFNGVSDNELYLMYVGLFGNPHDQIWIARTINRNISTFSTGYLLSSGDEYGCYAIGRGHGDIAWYGNSVVFVYQWFQYGDNVTYGADTALAFSRPYVPAAEAAPISELINGT